MVRCVTTHTSARLPRAGGNTQAPHPWNRRILSTSFDNRSLVDWSIALTKVNMTARGYEELRITFLGTRGEIRERTRRHRRHSALLAQAGTERLMIDCGLDWLGHIGRIRPSAILITHVHPDHAGGLAGGAPCPVYATARGWEAIGRFPITHREVIDDGAALRFGPIACRPFAVEHSIRAPAVGFRLSVGRFAIFYVPDVVAIHDRSAALRHLTYYIGDGATVVRSFVRRRGTTLIGHTPIRTQLGWCEAEGVARAIFTHCGSEIVGSDGRSVAARIARLGRERGVVARVAHDGMRCDLAAGWPDRC